MGANLFAHKYNIALLFIFDFIDINVSSRKKKKKCRLVDFINFITQNFHIQFQISSWPVCRERSGWNKNLRFKKVQTGPSTHFWPSVIINFIENSLWVVCWSLLLTPGHFPSSRDLRRIKLWEGFWLHVASKHTLCNDDSRRHASPISVNHSWVWRL